MEFLYFALYGIFCGFIFLGLLFIRRLFNFNLIITYVLDFLWGLSIPILFGICLINYVNGVFKVFELLAFAIGILAAIISLEKLVATSADFVYNKIVIKFTSAIKATCKRGLKKWKHKNLPK